MNLTPKIVEMMAKEYEENQKYKVKPWELKKGDKARHGEQVYTFIKMDGMYAQWEDEEGGVAIGHNGSYELGEDGVYY